METRLSQVKEFNAIAQEHKLYMYTMTTGNGSMIDKPCVKGWVVYQLQVLGDTHDFAKWFSNKQAAELELSVRA